MTCSCHACTMPLREPLTVSVPEAAVLLGIGRSSAYAAVRVGQLQAVRLGGRLRVTRAELARFSHDSNGVDRAGAQEARDQPDLARLRRGVRVVDWLRQLDPQFYDGAILTDLPGTSQDLADVISMAWEALGPDVDLGATLAEVRRHINEA